MMRKHETLLLYILLEFTLLCLMFTLLFGDVSMPLVIEGTMILLNIISLYVFLSILSQINELAHVSSENEIGERQKIIQDHYQTTQTQNLANINKMRNEITRHIEKMEDLDDIDAETLALQFIEDYKSLYLMHNCSNSTIDALLYNKLLLAQSLHIETSCQVSLEEELPFNTIDLVSVFTNLIDNAIEANKAFPIEKRFMRIDCFHRLGYLVIKITNPKYSNKVIDLDHLQTSKPDHDHHGYGLQIVSRICALHEGSLHLQDDSESLTMVATLKYSKEKGC